MGGWSFLSNHARVLVCVARDPDLRLRDLAVQVGITERAAHRLVSDLCRDGYLSRERRGSRNQYEVHLDQPLREPLAGEQAQVGALLAPLVPLVAPGSGSTVAP